MIEELIYFNSDGLKLYGMLHRPQDIVFAPAVILFHGLSGERVESHRIFVKLARSLAKVGIATLRFDFRGSGESEGEFEDITISDWINDGLAGVSWLLEQHGINKDRIGLLGLSMGGSTAAIVAGRLRGQVKALVLWSAAADIVRAVYTWLQATNPTSTKDGYDIGGNILGNRFLIDLRNADPIEEIAHYPGPALIIHGTNDDIVPFTNADSFNAAMNGRARKYMINGANHTFTKLEWEQDVLVETTSFFRKILIDSSEFVEHKQL